ncbi:MAG TPA: AraC family transcriptional regulator [Firmicutes bacterium]|nr:AraC family transcriptional regulator [Bacillota bacterium]
MAILREYRDNKVYFHHTMDLHPRAADFGIHVHEECELLYFVSGNAQCLVETTVYPLEPHSLLVIRNMESHMIRIQGDAAYERYGIHFFPGLLDSVDPAHTLLRPFLDRPLGQDNLYHAEEFAGIRPHELFLSMVSADPSEESQRRTLLLYLYPLFGQILEAFRKKQTGRKAPAKQGMAQEMVAYINRHLFEELSLEALSQQFFMSQSQLNRIFKEQVGSSVWDYILYKRLVAARNLIRDGHSAGDACAACGFKDYSSFYRSYVRRFGSSPKQDMLIRSPGVPG